MKRGQVTIFIIVGVAFLILAILIVFLATFRSMPDLETDSLTPKINLYIESCLKDSLDDSVKKFMITGGNMDNAAPLLYIDRRGINVGYAKKFNTNLVPPEQISELAIASDAVQATNECVNELIGSLEGVDMELDDDMFIDLEIVDEQLQAKLYLNMSAQMSDGKFYFIDELETTLPSRLREMLRASRIIIEDSFNGQVDLRDYDFSGSDIYACYEQGKFLKLIFYQQSYNQRSQIMQFATDRSIGVDTCTGGTV